MAEPTALPRSRLALGKRRLGDRVGDRTLIILSGGAALTAIALVILIAYELFREAWPAIQEFGAAFITGREWNAVTNQFGALDFIFGTLYTSLIAVLLAGPLAIAIAVFLTELAPRVTRGAIGTLVELLAAIPSVVMGLWGIFVLGPIVRDDIGPALQSVLGWTPFFKGTPQITGYLTASLVLTFMILPITASVARELLRTVPADLKEASLALGMTRWEMIRGVMIPYTRGGLVAAVILGLGRALGEAIAVLQVIGGTLGISLSLFANGDTLASRIAAQYQGATSHLQTASLIYLALILLAISLVTNLAAQIIVRRFEKQRAGGS
jgi:phosphate transport system permease protein